MCDPGARRLLGRGRSQYGGRRSDRRGGRRGCRRGRRCHLGRGRRRRGWLLAARSALAAWVAAGWAVRRRRAAPRRAPRRAPPPPPPPQTPLSLEHARLSQARLSGRAPALVWRGPLSVASVIPLLQKPCALTHPLSLSLMPPAWLPSQPLPWASFLSPARAARRSAPCTFEASSKAPTSPRASPSQPASAPSAAVLVSGSMSAAGRAASGAGTGRSGG